MAFLGKTYTLVGQENFDTWIRATVSDASEEMIAAMLAEKPTVKVVQDGDSYIFSQSGPKGVRDTTFKSGVEFDDVIGHKSTPIKSTYTVSGNTITQVIVSPQGTATFKREFNGDDLVVTITSDKVDVVAKRYYKA